MNNNEMAAFEGFKFKIGDIVRLIVERAATKVITEEAQRGDAVAQITPAIGMVTYRHLDQDESGISRYYHVKGTVFSGDFKEFEIEPVEERE